MGCYIISFLPFFKYVSCSYVCVTSGRLHPVFKGHVGCLIIIFLISCIFTHRWTLTSRSRQPGPGAEDSLGIIPAGPSFPCRRPLGQEVSGFQSSLWALTQAVFLSPHRYVNYGILSHVQQTNDIIAPGGKSKPGSASGNWPGRKY